MTTYPRFCQKRPLNWLDYLAEYIHIPSQEHVVVSDGLLVGAGTSLPAQAVFIITLREVGSDVVATGSGTINTAGLSLGPVTTTVTRSGLSDVL